MILRLKYQFWHKNTNNYLDFQEFIEKVTFGNHTKLTQAAESVRMTLLDHIILADEQYYSFNDNKKL